MENKEQFEFIAEKVKDRPLNKRKLIRKMLLTVSMAVLFGLFACLTFSAMEPVISNWLHPQEQVEPIEIPDIVEEVLPEDMVVHEKDMLEPNQEVIDTIKDEIQLGTTEYREMYQEIYTLAQKMESAMVVVTGVSQETDWLKGSYENVGEATGFIFAQNNTDIMIMVGTDTIADNDRFEVTFTDGRKVAAQLKGTDSNSNLSILSVKKNVLPASTLEEITCVNLGSSNTNSLLAAPVVAVGSPLGKESIVYGMITSTETIIHMPDANYRLLNTDIYGSSFASGLLMDLDGRVIGIINQEYNDKDMSNLISALGITEIKSSLQKLANGMENSYLGLLAMDVPEDITSQDGVPDGVYVNSVVMDSPAMQAGIQSGDIIIKIGKNNITGFSDYRNILSESKPEEVKTVILMRQGQEGYKAVSMDVVIGRQP